MIRIYTSSLLFLLTCLVLLNILYVKYAVLLALQELIFFLQVGTSSADALHVSVL